MRLDLGDADDVSHRTAVEQMQTPKPVHLGLQDRILAGAGNSLIALGQRLRNMTINHSDQDTEVSLWDDAT
jgi:hypothetical protein